MTITLRKSLNFVLKSAMLLIACFCLSCSSDDTKDEGNTGDGGGTEEPGGDEYEDIKVVDGKVRFYLYEDDNAARKAMGVKAYNWTTANVAVNGKAYEISVDDKGRRYIEVTEASSGTYNATLSTAESSKWYGSSLYADVKLPYSQFWTATAAALNTYPMYASYTKENGNKLKFNDGFAVLDLALTGSAKISSVKVESLDGTLLAGFANLMPSRGYFTINTGLDFAVLNCTDSGNYVELNSGSAKHFYVMLAAGSYSDGLKITICDSDHRAMIHTIQNTTFTAGVATPVELAYSPDSDLVFYEGFDNFVWGGDIMGGSESVGYAPNDDEITYSTGLDREGYADSFTPVDCNMPGSGFIQSNTWSDVSGYTVGTSHIVTDSYVASRNLADFAYMFRCQEYQGCVAVGAGNSGRGIMQTCPMPKLTGFNNLKISFDFCFQNGIQDNLLFQIVNGGIIESATLNGNAVSLTKENYGYEANASQLVTLNSSVSIPSSDVAPKEWARLEVVVKDATSGTALYFAGNDANLSGKHGFYVDNIEARRIGDYYQPGANTLRVLYWNIQNGMWADQPNNYDNFVQWVKSYDPDVCVWCEAASNYKDNSSSPITGTRYLPDGWPVLAARYGHAYTAKGGHRDNFPQVVTSKYPITTLLKITDSDTPDKPITHGAALHQITVNGKTINLVTLHMWPQAWAYGDSSQSSANHEGDYYREFEIKYIVANTINDPKYADQQDWLMMGDFNSRSRDDEWFYNYGLDDTRYLVHNHILDNTNMKDIMTNYYPGFFISSTGGNSRIDFMYASPSMYDRIDHTVTLMDKWTTIVKTPFSNFSDPSDHRPIMTDFNME